MSQDLDALWPEDLVLDCPMCRRRTPRKEPVDPGIFRCRSCDVVLFPQIKNGVSRLMIGTSSFLFEPMGWHQVGRKPWTGELMLPVAFEPKTPLAGMRVEPKLPGSRVIIVVSRDHEVMSWSGDGSTRQGVSEEMRHDAVSLACLLRWEGWAHDRYMMGVVLDCVVFKNRIYVMHQMPLTSFLRGGESIDGSASHQILSRLDAERELQVMQVMPFASLDNGWLIGAGPGGLSHDHLDALCTHWNVAELVLKDEHYFWRFGPSRAWMTYVGGEL